MVKIRKKIFWKEGCLPFHQRRPSASVCYQPLPLEYHCIQITNFLSHCRPLQMNQLPLHNKCDDSHEKERNGEKDLLAQQYRGQVKETKKSQWKILSCFWYRIFCGKIKPRKLITQTFVLGSALASMTKLIIIFHYYLLQLVWKNLN